MTIVIAGAVTNKKRMRDGRKTVNPIFFNSLDQCRLVTGRDHAGTDFPYQVRKKYYYCVETQACQDQYGCVYALMLFI
ncbi:hypothetical protein SXCC_01632 [Gluconacetobacter sp. SXCC-1]|nr:hypothetical protein SXCC_01632 [Gluconacetobacter sp. SXCC-1]